MEIYSYCSEYHQSYLGLNYGKNHYENYLGQFWDHDYLTRLLTDFENIVHLLKTLANHKR